MTLDAWFAVNCKYLEHAWQEVPAKHDLAPMFAGMKDGIAIVFAAQLLLRLDKEMAVDLFRGILKAAGADQYAIITAAWYVAVPRGEHAAAARQIIDQEGTGGAYKDQRREAYQVIVGDRERTLTALYDVTRDYKGKIRRLDRVTDAPEIMSGRMCDLLVEPQTVH